MGRGGFLSIELPLRRPLAIAIKRTEYNGIVYRVTLPVALNRLTTILVISQQQHVVTVSLR